MYTVKDRYGAIRARHPVRAEALADASQIPGAVVWYEPEKEE